MKIADIATRKRASQLPARIMSTIAALGDDEVLTIEELADKLNYSHTYLNNRIAKVVPDDCKTRLGHAHYYGTPAGIRNLRSIHENRTCPSSRRPRGEARR